MASSAIAGARKALLMALLVGALSAHADDPRPPSGIPAIDSLPLHDWQVDNPPLSYSKALLLGALIPGGGQFYGHHPVRGAFLVGLEGALFGLSLSAYFHDLPLWDRQTSSYLDSADAALGRSALDPSAQGDFLKWVALARNKADTRLRQADLANSELAWAIGLHFYGLADAMEIVHQSREPNPPVRSVKRAMLYGILFPGGGQLYNGRYGKFGLLWMGLGGAALSAWSRQNVVEALNREVATAEAEQAQGQTPLQDLNQLQLDRTLYRKRRNQYYWGMSLFYLYAVLDGMVDAALSDFDRPNRYSLGPGLTPLSVAANISF